MILENTFNKVIWRGRTSDIYEVRNEVRQGLPLSTLLFSISLVVRKSRINQSRSVINSEHQCIAYADNVAIMANKKLDLTKIVKTLITTAKKCWTANQHPEVKIHGNVKTPRPHTTP